MAVVNRVNTCQCRHAVSAFCCIVDYGYITPCRGP